MTLSLNKTRYVTTPGTVLNVKYTVTNNWQDAFQDKWRLWLESDYYNNGIPVYFPLRMLKKGGKTEGILKLSTPKLETSYGVKLRLKIRRKSDGKEVTESFSSFNVETKYGTTEPKPEPEQGEGKAVIAFTGVDKGPVYNINTNIETYLDVSNMGADDDIIVKYGIGYFDGTQISFTGVVATDSMFIKKYQSFKFIGTIPVRLTDYNAKNMTARGPSMIFIAGHKVGSGDTVWDSVKYTPIRLNLVSGYIDPLDPDADGEPGGEPPGGWSDPWDEPGTASGWPDPDKYPGGVSDPEWEEKEEHGPTWLDLLRQWLQDNIGKVIIKKGPG